MLFLLYIELKMEIFLDTANLKSIRHYNEMGMLDGITTTPTLLSKEDALECGRAGCICSASGKAAYGLSIRKAFVGLLRQSLQALGWSNAVKTSGPIHSRPAGLERALSATR